MSRHTAKADLLTKYGPWAVVAGASRGAGAAYARALAARGFHLVLIARNENDLNAVADSVATSHGIEVRTVRTDLGTDGALAAVRNATAGVDVGLLVYNAGLSNPGAFLESSVDRHLETLYVNCRGALTFVHDFAASVRSRVRASSSDVSCRRAGIILMSSMTSFAGSPGVATYGATRAFTVAFGQAIGHELRASNIDVLVCSAGVIRDRSPRPVAAPGNRPRSVAGTASGKRLRIVPPTTTPRYVAERALRALGRRRLVIPGPRNRALAFFMSRLLPRAFAVRLMAWTVKNLDFEGHAGQPGTLHERGREPAQE